MPAFTLQTLSDRAEISDIFNRYALALDTRDWALFRNCFTEDVEVDLTGMHPGLVFSGADAIVAYAENTIAALEVTQHIITNHNHVIDGDTAKSTAYLHGQHVARNEAGELIQCVLGGYYTYGLRRTENGWRISSYTLTITWNAGSGAELANALDRARG